MRILFFAFLLLFSVPITAQTCCSGGVPLSNNLGLPNEGKGSLSLGLSYDYNNLNTLNSGSDKLDDNSRKRITNSVLFNIGYSITDKLSVESLFTWVNQTRTITQFGDENFTETKGLGDAVFLLKYAFPEVLGNGTLLNVGLGTKAPLGRSNATRENGILHTADLQPGSGAWDGIGWLSATKNLGFRPSANLIASFTYRLTGKNNTYLDDSATYEFSDAIQSNLGYTDQFLIANIIVNPGLVFKYRKSGKDKIDGSEIPNTGGEWVFARPELGVHISSSIRMDTRLELPIYSYVDGTQLTPTARVTVGMFFTLKKKETNIVN